MVIKQLPVCCFQTLGAIEIQLEEQEHRSFTTSERNSEERERENR